MEDFVGRLVDKCYTCIYDIYTIFKFTKKNIFIFSNNNNYTISPQLSNIIDNFLYIDKKCGNKLKKEHIAILNDIKKKFNTINEENIKLNYNILTNVISEKNLCCLIDHFINNN